MTEQGELNGGIRFFPENVDVTDMAAAMAHAAVAEVVRRGPPLACETIDRRALDRFHQHLTDDGVQSLMCFSCACVFPYVEAQRRHSIKWVQPLSVAHTEEATFLNLKMARAKELFGCAQYQSKYGALEQGPRLNADPYKGEFED